MSMDWIRSNYGVPAKRGGRVEFAPGYKPAVVGTITGCRNGRLIIRLDGERSSRLYHPTWMLRYLPAQSEGRDG